MEIATSPPGKPGRPVLESIQALRAVAAYSVLVCHVCNIPLGAAGVDVFFVISGFLMGHIGIGEAPITFLKRRVVRIVPLYWLVTLATGVAYLLGNIGKYAFDGTDLVLSLAFIPHTNLQGALFPLVVPGWTLNYEMFFYVLFACALLTARPAWLAMAALVALVGAGLATEPSGPLGATYTSPLMLEFAGGLALSIAPPLRTAMAGLALLLAGAALFVAAALHYEAGFPEGFDRAAFLGLPAWLLVAGALASERAGLWPRSRIARLLGDASYGIYLVHDLILTVVTHFVHRLWLAAPVVVIATTVAAIVMNRAIEKPLIRRFR